MFVAERQVDSRLVTRRGQTRQMFGGVAGHAGLFSNAYDLAKLYQLLLNGGELNGLRLLSFALIWLSVAIYTADSLLRRR